MAIRILYGPGGTGKSYKQIRVVVDELRHTKRNIVTNLSIDIPRLQEWLEQNYPDEVIDAGKRIRILNVEETKQFWKYRGNVLLTPSQTFDDTPDYGDDKGVWGVCYIIDEAGAAGFNARGWAATEGRSTRGVECEWYLDQQRKFADDVWASANGRAPTAIAKPFRDKAHEFVRLKNGYLATYGRFRGVGKFTARYYTHEPDKTSEPFKQEEWKMDATGLASCYRTQDGVGVTGTTADIGKRAKGIPAQFIIPGVILALLVVFVGGGRLSKWVITKDKPAAKSGSENLTSKANGSENLTSKAAQVPTVASERVSIAPGTRVRGYAVRKNGTANVVLDDGRTIIEGEGLTNIERNGVSFGRVKLFMAQAGAVVADAVRQTGEAVRQTVQSQTRNDVQATPPAITASTYVDERVIPTAESAERVKAALSGVSPFATVPTLGGSQNARK